MEKLQKHICFFNSHFNWGGGEKWHFETAEYFVKNGITVSVCAAKNSKLLSKCAYFTKTHAVRIKNLSFLNIFKYILLYSFFKKQKFSTIIFTLPIDLKVAGVAAKLAGVKNIVYVRSVAVPIKNSFTNRYLFSKIITHVIANSEATKQAILHNNKNLCNPDLIKVLYLGVDTSLQFKKEPKNTVPIIASAGRLEDHKQFEVLIECAKILHNKNISCKFLIAGEGALEIELQKKVVDAQLQTVIEFIGFTSNIHSFLEKADVFVLPSKGEGFGYVFCEAMLHSLPIVAFNVASAPELIIHNKTGLLVEPYSVTGFAHAIETLLSQPLLISEFGSNGNILVKQKFDTFDNLKKTVHYILQI